MDPCSVGAGVLSAVPSVKINMIGRRNRLFKLHQEEIGTGITSIASMCTEECARDRI